MGSHGLAKGSGPQGLDRIGHGLGSPWARLAMCLAWLARSLAVLVGYVLVWGWSAHGLGSLWVELATGCALHTLGWPFPGYGLGWPFSGYGLG